MLLGFLLVLTFFVCLLIILLVLLQAGRGGGLVGALTGVATDTLFGAGSRNPLRKMTAVLGAILFIVCLVVGLINMRRAGMLPAAPAPKGTPPPATAPIQPAAPAAPAKGEP